MAKGKAGVMTTDNTGLNPVAPVAGMTDRKGKKIATKKKPVVRGVNAPKPVGKDAKRNTRAFQ